MQLALSYCNILCTVLHTKVYLLLFSGPHLRGPSEPGPQASHQQRTSHQTLCFDSGSIDAHDSSVRNFDIIIVDATHYFFTF